MTRRLNDPSLIAEVNATLAWANRYYPARELKPPTITADKALILALFARTTSRTQHLALVDRASVRVWFKR